MTDDIKDWEPDAAGLLGGRMSEVEAERLLRHNAAWDKWSRARSRAVERFQTDTADAAKAYHKATKDQRARYLSDVNRANKAYRDALMEIEISARTALDVMIPQPLRDITDCPAEEDEQQ